jgi:hypothetical protein
MQSKEDQFQVFDNVTIKMLSHSGSSSVLASGNNNPSEGNGGNGNSGGGVRFRDRTPPIVTGVFSRPPDREGLYTHPFNVTWVGEDGRSGIAFCDPPTKYSGPDGNSIVLTGHCTDGAGNEGSGQVTFNYNSTLFVPLFSYDLALSHSAINFGSSILGTAATSDTTVKQVTFVWKNVLNETKATNVRSLLSNGTSKDSFIPDSLGQWKVVAYFSNDTHSNVATKSRSFLVNFANDGGGNGGNGDHAPLVANDVITTTEDVPIAINVLANDSDPDGNAIVISFYSQPINGSVTLNLNGTLTYAPKLDFNGHDSFSYRISDGFLQSATNATVALSVTPINDAPRADAGPDQNVKEKSKVSLSGALSSDVDGDSLTYNWTQRGGPTVNLSNPISINPSFVAPMITGNTTLIFELRVADQSGASSVDSVNIIVFDKNSDNNGGDDDCEDNHRHKHGDTHKHKEKDEDRHKHGDTHKHKPKGNDCDDDNDHDRGNRNDRDNGKSDDREDRDGDDNSNDNEKDSSSRKENEHGDPHDDSDNKEDNRNKKQNSDDEKHNDDERSKRHNKDDSNDRIKDNKDKNESKKKDKKQQ